MEARRVAAASAVRTGQLGWGPLPRACLGPNAPTPDHSMGYVPTAHMHSAPPAECPGCPHTRATHPYTPPTLNVLNASEAISKFATSTLSKNLRNTGPSSTFLCTVGGIKGRRRAPRKLLLIAVHCRNRATLLLQAMRR